VSILQTSPSWLDDCLGKVPHARVAVFGDFCLDAYWLIDSDLSELSIETGLPMHEFHRCVRLDRGNFHCRRLTYYEQFICLAFAQLTYRERLRDIETCLRALDKKLYRAAVSGPVARSTMAKANEERDWRDLVTSRQSSDRKESGCVRSMASRCTGFKHILNRK